MIAVQCSRSIKVYNVYERIAHLKNLSNSRSPDGLVYVVPADNIGMQVNSSLSEGAHRLSVDDSCTKSKNISSINANDMQESCSCSYICRVLLGLSLEKCPRYSSIS